MVITRVNHGIHSLIIGSVGVVCVVVAIVAALAGGHVLHLVDHVLETHFELLIGRLRAASENKSVT